VIGKDETKPQSKVRRSVFAVWIALTIVAALYVGVAGPLTPQLPSDMWLVGVIVPPLLIILAGIGLAWLAWLCLGGGRRRLESLDAPQRSANHQPETE
jgi:quinol-cytochrome oxidoreductase complex cytochrome b subunit